MMIAPLCDANLGIDGPSRHLPSSTSSKRSTIALACRLMQPGKAERFVAQHFPGRLPITGTSKLPDLDLPHRLQRCGHGVAAPPAAPDRLRTCAARSQCPVHAERDHAGTQPLCGETQSDFFCMVPVKHGAPEFSFVLSCCSAASRALFFRFCSFVKFCCQRQQTASDRGIVRRQGFRDNGLSKLREALAHRVGDVRRPAAGAASGG